MNTYKIYDENGRGFFRIFKDYKIEKVNPIKHYKSYELKKRAILILDYYCLLKDPRLSSCLPPEFFIKEAGETLVGYFEEIEQTKIHDNFIKLLKTTRKKDQEKLLKGMTLNPNQFRSLIFISYKDFGFLYSRYLFEKNPCSLKGRKLPELFYIKKDETIAKVGETDLSDGELKNVIEHKKVFVLTFFEKEDFWHCFFLTYNSIRGKENWKGGQAHFHYISSSFGLSKEKFVESVQTGKYKSTSIHIPLLDYGNQTNRIMPLA